MIILPRFEVETIYQLLINFN